MVSLMNAGENAKRGCLFAPHNADHVQLGRATLLHLLTRRNAASIGTTTRLMLERKRALATHSDLHIQVWKLVTMQQVL